MQRDKMMSLSIREEEYEFVDPRPEEMKHVNINHSIPALYLTLTDLR